MNSPTLVASSVSRWRAENGAADIVAKGSAAREGGSPPLS